MNSRIWCALVTSTLLLGCGGDDETNGTPTSDAVALTGDVFDFETDLSVKDFKACQFEHPEVACSMTNVQGGYTLQVAKNQNALVELTHADYFPYLRTAVVKDQPVYIHGIPHIKTALWEMLGGLAGGLDKTKGQLSFEITSGKTYDAKNPAFLEGVKVSLEGGAGTVVYMDMGPMGLGPNPMLMATSKTAIGLILNVPPGDYTPKIEAPNGMTCTPEPTHTWTKDGHATVRSVAGYHNFGFVMLCN